MLSRRKAKTFNFLKDAKDFFVLFIRTSSIHGFNHLVAKKRHPAEKVFWLIMISIAMWQTISTSLATWERFSLNPTVVSIERNYKEWRTYFPAVSICPKAKYQEDYISEYVENTYPNVPDKNKMETFVQQLAKLTLTDDEIKTDDNTIKPRNYWKVLDDVKFRFIYNVSNSNLDLFKVVQMTKSFTESGICYVYNSALAQYFSPRCWDSNDCKFDPDVLLFQGSPLQGDIFAQVMNMNAPYGMYIHGPWEVPDAAISSMDSANNSYKTLDLTGISLYSTDATKQLTVRQRKCRIPSESNLAISPVYSYNICRMDCRVNKMISVCNCVPHFYRYTGPAKFCDFNGLKCINENRELFIKLMDPETRVKVKCDCVPSCDEVNYFIDTDNTMAWNLGTNLKWGMTKYPKMRLKRDILFGWSDVLVAIGGTAGLFLGCSLLSFAEIFYFFTLRLLLFIIRRCKG